jgi:hypothetical protein
MQKDTSAHTEPTAGAATPPGAGPSTGGAPGAAARPGTPTSIIPRTDLDDAHLVTRAAVGLLTEGVEYFIKQMRAAQAKIDANPQMLLPTLRRSPETRADLLRYLVIGAVLAGERQASQALETGLQMTAQTTGFVGGILDRLTDNPLLRPARQPFAGVLDNVAATMDVWVKQGRVEEQNGRVVLARTVTETIDDIITYISDAEELAALVSEQINQQGATVAGAALETGRSATLVTDTVVERFVRRLLRRPQRDELPASPLHGKPQDMYTPDKRIVIEKIQP